MTDIRRRRLRQVLAVGALSLVLTACGGGSGLDTSENSGEVDRDATLRVSNLVAATLDPANSVTSGQALLVTWPVIDRLIQISEDGTLEPMLATEWEFSEDGKALTMNLREGVTFSDGSPFNAEAVKASIDYYKSGEGAAAKEGTANIEAVKVLGEFQVEIQLTRPTTTILTALAAPAGGGMLSPASIKSGNADSKPIGTGAWVVDEFEPGQRVTFTRRPDAEIWDPETGKAKHVEIQWLQVDALYNALRSGQIDIGIANGGLDPVKSEIDQGRLDYRAVPTSMAMQALYLNHDVKPLDDVRVRQAVNYAIDREAIAEAFGGGNEFRVQPYPKGLLGFDDEREKRYSYDPDEAKRLLKEAGHADGVELGEVLVANAGDQPMIAQAIQQQLKEVGIGIELLPGEAAGLSVEYGKGKTAGMVQYFGSSAASPQAFFNAILRNPARMPSGISEEVDELTTGIDDPALSETEVEERAAAGVDYLTDQAYFAPLLQGSPYFVHVPTVTGWDEGTLPYISLGVGDFREVGLTK